MFASNNFGFGVMRRKKKLYIRCYVDRKGREEKKKKKKKFANEISQLKVFVCVTAHPEWE